MQRRRIIRHEHLCARDQLRGCEQRQSPGAIDRARADCPQNLARQIHIFRRTDNHDASVDEGRERGIVRPFLRRPHAAGCEGDERLALPSPLAQHRVDLVALRLSWEQSWTQHLGAWFDSRLESQPQETRCVMLPFQIVDAPGVKAAARGSCKSDALTYAGAEHQRSAAHGTLCQIRGRITTPAQPRREQQRADEPSIAPTLVVDVDLAYRRIVCQQRCRRRRDDDIDGPALSEMRDQGRRENRVAEKGRLNDETRAFHSVLLVHLQHREKRFLRYLHGADLLHPLLSLLLLLEELALARYVAAVALRQDVLS